MVRLTTSRNRLPATAATASPPMTGNEVQPDEPASMKAPVSENSVSTTRPWPAQSIGGLSALVGVSCRNR
nr:hypothetical protein [Mesorhizobium huakuii]